MRKSARVMLINSSIPAILLIKFSIVREGKPFVFWATPGGALEAGETDLDAAYRELAEELHLSVLLEGPVHRSSSTFEHNGAVVENQDVFFLGFCSQASFKLDGVDIEERAAMQVAKWWSAEEIERSAEQIFPLNLGPLVRKLASSVATPNSVS